MKKIKNKLIACLLSISLFGGAMTMPAYAAFSLGTDDVYGQHIWMGWTYFESGTEGYADGTKTNTGGLLKVLRNPKHYYKVVLNSNDVLPTVEIGGDEDISKNLGIFGYRQITKEELDKQVSDLLTVVNLDAIKNTWS